MRHNLTMLQGSARVGKVDPWQSSVLRKRGLSHLLVHKRVPMRTVGAILEQEGVRSVGYFKMYAAPRSPRRPWLPPCLTCACNVRQRPQRRRAANTALPARCMRGAAGSLAAATGVRTGGHGQLGQEAGAHPHVREHGYKLELKPAHVLKRGHSLRYSHLTFDMVMSRNLTEAKGAKPGLARR